jgi:Fe2+ transport system protein FeoA
MQLIVLELVQQAFLRAETDELLETAEASVTLTRLSLLQRTPHTLAVRCRALQLRLRHEEACRAVLEDQRVELQEAMEELQEEHESQGDNAARLQADFDLMRRELGFDPDRYTMELYIEFIREMRQRPPVVGAAPREAQAVREHMSQMLVALGFHPDYDQLCVVLGRIAELRLRPARPLPEVILAALQDGP